MSVNTKVNGQLVKSAGLYSVSTPIGMADIYSTEEKEVGLWVDNKPLYQKTFLITPTSQSSTIDVSSLNIEKLIDRQATFTRTISSSNIQQKDVEYRTETNTNPNYGILCELRQNYIQLSVEAYTLSEITEIRLTIKYTKTTDTPWSGKFVPQGYGYVSSGDIYSEQERQIGVFIDGKPLYQKTISINALPSTAYTTVDYPHNISNIDKIVEWRGYGKFASDAVTILPCMQFSSTEVLRGASYYAQVNKTNVTIMTGMDRSNMSALFTIRYTKTTDVAGSGEYVPSGDKAVHYDDTEQVIGTWFGETLYRKTINFGALPNTTLKNVAHGISNLGYIKSYEGTAYNPTNGYYISLPYLHSSVSNNDVEIYFNETNASIVTKTDRTPYTTCYITLEYTKTS